MADKPPRRGYRCANRHCQHYGSVLEVEGKPRGPFFEWPNLRCLCGMEPEIMWANEGLIWK